MAFRPRSAKSYSPVVSALLQEHGVLYSRQLGIDLSKGTPSPLFRWLCGSILFSARITTDKAASAATALAKAGWKTPRAMAATQWEDRVRVLNRSGYARYDESTARMLGETTELLMSRYKGDLRRLREAAGKAPEDERTLLKEFKGLGDVGVSIFFREMQIVWDELYPFADDKALEGARRLRLGQSADDLTGLVSRRDYPRLIAALVRMQLAGDAAEMQRAANG